MIRLTRSDVRLIGIAATVAAGSLLLTQRYFHRAFPEASIDFQVSIAGSEPIADQFLAARGLSTAGYMHASQFDYDDEAKTFLEREIGVARTGELLRSRIRLWSWDNRWFRPLSKEELHVVVTTSGQVAGFNHPVAEDAAGDSLTENAARAKAEHFLSDAMHLDLGALAPVATDRQVKPHRVDYVFTWKDTAALVPGGTGYIAQAEYRREIRVQGAEVAAYGEFLKVPDQWGRDYDRLRSRNETTGRIDEGLMLVLGVALLVVLALRVRRSDVRWRPARWVGGTGAVLSFLSSLNSIGAERYAYETTSAYGTFLAETLFSALAGAIALGVVLAILTAAAEPLYRERLPGAISLDGLLTRRGLRSKSVFISLILGASLAAFFFAYQTVFYLVANHFGAWAPMDVPYDDLLNTKLPWAFVLFGGFFPAISEEFTFRMFAIPLFQKWFRFLAVAIVAASYLWGFGHATYPNQPFYIRGVEVGTGGLLLSWIMMRYGILTTVVWHYTVDAVYTAMLLLRAHEPYLRLSGAITAFIALIPLLIAAIAYLRTGTFSEELGILNAAPSPGAGGSEAAVGETPPSEVAARHDTERERGAETGSAASATPDSPLVPPGAPPYTRISKRSWIIGFGVAAALLASFAISLPSWDAVLPWHLSKADAIAAARAFLQAQGYDVATYRVAAETATPAQVTGENAIAAADIFTARGRPALMAAFSGPPPTVVARYWRIRFFKILQEEEFSIGVRADDGRVLSWVHHVSETAAGAAPALASAESSATAFLRQQGIDVAGYDLKTAEQEKRPARTDSHFEWERTGSSPLPGEVAYRVDADLLGNRISTYHGWYHVPETRVRELARVTPVGVVLGAFRVLLVIVVIVFFGRLFFRAVRSDRVEWRPLITIAIAAGCLTVLMSLNGLPGDIAGYETSQPWSAFVVTQLIEIPSAGVGAVLLALAVLGTLSMTTPWVVALSRANLRTFLSSDRARDALGAGLLAPVIGMGWAHVQAIVSAHWHGAATGTTAAPPSSVTNLVPGLDSLLSAPLLALFGAAALGLVLPVLYGWWVSPHRRFIAVLVVLGAWVASFPAAHDPRQILFSALISAISIGWFLTFAWFFLGRNVLAYISNLLLGTLIAPGIELLKLPVGSARLVGAVMLVAAVAWVAWLGRIALRPSRGVP